MRQRGDVSGAQVQVLVLCGASGTGKTATLWEIGHQLQSLGVPHALIETDELDRVWPQPEPVEALVAVTRRNLRSVWATYSGLGVRHLVLSGVMASISRAETWIAESIPGASVTFVRLTADRRTREQRIRRREAGSGFERELEASERDSAFIDDHDAEDLARVATDGKNVVGVAREVLTVASWPFRSSPGSRE